MKNILKKIKECFNDFSGCLFASRGGWTEVDKLLLKIATMQKSLRMYKEFWDNTTDAMILCRVRDGQILEVNPSACSLYGYSRDQFVLKTMYDVSDDPKGTKTTADGKLPYVPFRYHFNSDGRKFSLSCRLTYFNDSGEDIAALIIQPIRLPEGVDIDRRPN